jgi:membrane dipeptidase
MSQPVTAIFDGHNDTLGRIVLDPHFDFLAEQSTGHLDLPRARRGGMVGGLFAIYAPPPVGSPERDSAWELAITEDGYRQKLHSAIPVSWAAEFTGLALSAIHRLAAGSEGAVRIASSAVDVEECRQDGALAMVIHLEGAEAVQTNLKNLAALYEQGVRSIGLVWSRPNAFGEGVPFAYPATPDTGPGLTGYGRALVQACDEMGILIDLAHINAQGFWDVAARSKSPLIVSHTDVHAICPSTRNLTDRQIDAIGASGGIIGLNFEPVQTSPDGRPHPDLPLSEIVRHVEYVANRIGIDHVGFGSDFDGTDMPDALTDAASLQNLIAALRKAGYDQASIEKVTYRNWLRVLPG